MAGSAAGRWERPLAPLARVRGGRITWRHCVGSWFEDEVEARKGSEMMANVESRPVLGVELETLDEKCIGRRAYVSRCA